MSTSDDLCEVIVTAPDADWLADLCHQLVDARLAASAHVIHPVTSIYRWRGDVHTTTEARAFLRLIVAGDRARAPSHRGLAGAGVLPMHRTQRARPSGLPWASGATVIGA